MTPWMAPKVLITFPGTPRTAGATLWLPGPLAYRLFDTALGGLVEDSKGGRGWDLLLGGDGADLLVRRPDLEEQRIGQLATGNLTPQDPENEVKFRRQKIYGWKYQAVVGDDIMRNGRREGSFIFESREVAPVGLDSIKDFRSGEDRFYCSDDINLQLAELNNFTRLSFFDGNQNELGVVKRAGRSLNPELDMEKFHLNLNVIDIFS